MILTVANSISYLVLGVSLGLVLGLYVLLLMLSFVATIVWNALLFVAACRTTTREVIS